MGLIDRLFRHSSSNKRVEPPVPLWKPSFKMPEADVIERIRYYTDNEKDFVVFEHGTCVVVKDGVSEEKAIQQASEFLSKVLYLDSPMDPLDMDDGHLLVRYKFPVYNLVISEVADAHETEIRAEYRRALRSGEILEGQRGPNQFDFHDMKALLGRSYFLMDAVDPVVSKIERATGCPGRGTKKPR